MPRNGLRALQKVLPAVRVDHGLFARKEPPADPAGAGTQRQGGSKPPTIRHAAGGDHRYAAHLIEDGRDQGHRRSHACDLTAGLRALSRDSA